jgi:hypothetical protein
MRYIELLEKLAELEHKQRADWAINIMKTENISHKRTRRWDSMLIEYKYLTEEQKEQDRIYARKVINLLTK